MPMSLEPCEKCGKHLSKCICYNEDVCPKCGKFLSDCAGHFNMEHHSKHGCSNLPPPRISNEDRDIIKLARSIDFKTLESKARLYNILQRACEQMELVKSRGIHLHTELKKLDEILQEFTDDVK